VHNLLTEVRACKCISTQYKLPRNQQASTLIGGIAKNCFIHCAKKSCAS
jgi:hypothetical protein